VRAEILRQSWRPPTRLADRAFTSAPREIQQHARRTDGRAKGHCLAGGVTPSSATAATDRDSDAVVLTYPCAYESQKQSQRERRRFGQARNRLEQIPVAALHQWTGADLGRHAGRAGVDRRARADR
jgi:hypothetical protein